MSCCAPALSRSSSAGGWAALRAVRTFSSLAPLNGSGARADAASGAAPCAQPLSRRGFGATPSGAARVVAAPSASFAALSEWQRAHLDARAAQPLVDGRARPGEQRLVVTRVPLAFAVPLQLNVAAPPAGVGRPPP